MSADTPPSRPPRVDGRRLRSERTKQLIIEANLAVAQENSPQVPTAAEIAHRAGYSVRSVFERFPDIRTLQVAAVDYALVQVAALAPARDSHGDRVTRIKTQVETRGQSCERWLPLWRSISSQAWSSGLAFRYGRSVVWALSASAIEMIRAPSGIASRSRRSG